MKTILFSKRVVLLALALVAIAAQCAVSSWLGIEPSGLDVGSGALLGWAIGHCDTLDGPVVSVARKALDTGDVNHVLPWVSPGDEDGIRRAFDHAMAVRQLGPHARELADTHFFETLVRVHRASEGAPYTGLKPAGADLGPAVRAADRALQTGFIKELVNLFTEAVRSGVHRHFQATRERRNFAVSDIAAGREYVEAYESYVHYVGRLWEAAAGGASRGLGFEHGAGEPPHAPHVH